VLGVEAGLEEGGGRIDALGAAGVLEVGEVGGLGGRVGSVEDRGPSCSGCCAQAGEFGGIVEGVEVDIGEEERGDGAGGGGGGLGGCGERE